MRIVKAKSVKDYLERYYKRDRYTGRGKEYAAVLYNRMKKNLKDAVML